MKLPSSILMRKATRLTRAGDISGAMALIKSALSGHPPVTTVTGDVSTSSSDDSDPSEHETSRLLEAPALAPESAFTDGVYTRDGVSMDYKLFVPARADENPAPLLLMLHGCTQYAQDFATGTQMNVIAQSAGMFVLYPTQSTSSNANKCWNWFEPAHQLRGSGEPAALSELTRQIVDSESIDSQRVFVAGFSAGGAMALIMAEQYPELYAAVGVHSGLPTGAAASMSEALSLMQNSSTGDSRQAALPDEIANDLPYQNLPAVNGQSTQSPENSEYQIPLIVFHGCQDRSVHCANAKRIIGAWLAREQARANPDNWKSSSMSHTTATGRRYVVTSYVTEEQPERTGCEYWQLIQGGHGWSGGNADGSFTDIQGPDASAEMVRFFLECVSAYPVREQVGLLARKARADTDTRTVT